MSKTKKSQTKPEGQEPTQNKLGMRFDAEGKF